NRSPAFGTGSVWNSELAGQLLGPELEELLLVRTDLLDVQLVDTRVQVGPDGVEIPLLVRAARHRAGHDVDGDLCGRLLEIARIGQDLAELSGNNQIAPQTMRSLCRSLGVRAVTHQHSGLYGFVAAAFGAEEVDQFFVGCHRAVPVAEARGQADRKST